MQNENSRPFAAFSVNDILDEKVCNSDGDHLGNIEDVVLSAAGKVAYIVLSYGGIFGTNLGDKRFAVPYNIFTIGKDDDGVTCILNISKTYLESAPGFDPADPPHFSDNAFAANIDSYYKEYVTSRKVI